MAVGIPVTAAVLIGTVAGSAISARWGQTHDRSTQLKQSRYSLILLSRAIGRMKLGARGLTVFYILAHVAVLLVGPFFLLKCPKREFAGVGPSVGSLGRGVLNTSSLYEACNAASGARAPSATGYETRKHVLMCLTYNSRVATAPTCLSPRAAAPTRAASFTILALLAAVAGIRRRVASLGTAAAWGTRASSSSSRSLHS